MKITNFQLPPVSLSRLETKSWVFFLLAVVQITGFPFWGARRGRKRRREEERERARRPTDRQSEGERGEGEKLSPSRIPPPGL